MTNSTEKAAEAVAQCNDRYARGLATLCAVSGAGATKFIDSLSDVAPDLARYLVEFAYGDINSRPALTPPDRQLVTLGALGALDDTAPELHFHIMEALEIGLTPVEVVEALIQLVPFTGFVRPLNAIAVARQVFKAASH